MELKDPEVKVKKLIKKSYEEMAKDKGLDKDEESLLLYFETCLVDNFGRVEGIRMNDIDHVNMKRFVESGLIEFGRLKAKEIEKLRKINMRRRWTHYVRFTDKAWEIAHKLRRERSDRMIETRFCSPSKVPKEERV